jgi:hypothetical protein
MFEGVTILSESDAPGLPLPPWQTDDHMAESLLGGFPAPRAIEQEAGIRFDVVSVTSRRPDGEASGFDFIGRYVADINADGPGRPVQGHYDLDAGTAWHQFLD